MSSGCRSARPAQSANESRAVRPGCLQGHSAQHRTIPFCGARLWHPDQPQRVDMRKRLAGQEVAAVGLDDTATAQNVYVRNYPAGTRHHTDHLELH
jgi:hypothetical protein